MAQFAYLGDHSAVTLWGIRFPQGVAVDVENPHALAKLRGNSHFAEVIGGVEVMASPGPAQTAPAVDVTDVPVKQKRKYTRKAA